MGGVRMVGKETRDCSGCGWAATARMSVAQAGVRDADGRVARHGADVHHGPGGALRGEPAPDAAVALALPAVPFRGASPARAATTRAIPPGVLGTRRGRTGAAAAVHLGLRFQALWRAERRRRSVTGPQQSSLRPKCFTS
jgi:hypothetical protein